MSQPLVIIYQNDNQWTRMTRYCKDVVFLDASYKGDSETFVQHATVYTCIDHLPVVIPIHTASFPFNFIL